MSFQTRKIKILLIEIQQFWPCIDNKTEKFEDEDNNTSCDVFL